MTLDTKNFEPKIIAFLCNWCSSLGADLAGVTRRKYPPNMVPIRVMCSSRVSPEFVFEALKNGADGVLIGGCYTPTDCHYVNGNFKTLKRVQLIKNILKQLNIDPRRLRLEWISASDDQKFASVTKEFVDEIKHLGPLKIRSRGDEL